MKKMLECPFVRCVLILFLQNREVLQKKVEYVLLYMDRTLDSIRAVNSA